MGLLSTGRRDCDRSDFKNKTKWWGRGSGLDSLGIIVKDSLQVSQEREGILGIRHDKQGIKQLWPGNRDISQPGEWSCRNHIYAGFPDRCARLRVWVIER